jgi:hypothetical protein
MQNKSEESLATILLIVLKKTLLLKQKNEKGDTILKKLTKAVLS